MTRLALVPALEHGWTGGQYSLYRALLGAYLVQAFLRLAPHDPTASMVLALGVGVLAGALLGLGARDRLAAFLACGAWAQLFTNDPSIANPSTPFVGLLLLLHACLPSAPYGSLDARGRDDPGGGWKLPAELFGALWIALAAAYAFDGYRGLAGATRFDAGALAAALELTFAPLALFARTRPVAWVALASLHAGSLVAFAFADRALAMLLVHVLAFDPGWVRGVRSGSSDRVYYDGDCGMCHTAVRFALAEDRPGTAFRFAALGGETFLSAVSEDARRTLPDSLVVQREDGVLLVRSAAVLEMGARLGGYWRLLALAVGLLPRALTDRAYDAIARVRKRVFPKPSGVCPVLARELRARFDA